MPIYDYKCGRCGVIIEKYQPRIEDSPMCCEARMERLPPIPAMVIMRGEGGYPSRQKFLRGSAPGAGRQINPWMSYDPADKSYDDLGRKKKTQE